jgi:DnaJ-class molecular chaperone
MTVKQLYHILGVSESASEEEIRKAYKKIAIKFHPDRCKDPKLMDEYNEKFKQINKAHEILTDKNKRDIYDQVGDDPDQNIDEIIRQREEMKRGFPFPFPFGNGPMHGQFRFEIDIIININLTLEEIYMGKTVNQEIKRVTLNQTKEKQFQTYEKETISIKISRGISVEKPIVVNKNGNKIMHDGILKKQGNIIYVVHETPHKIFERSQQQPLHLLMKHKITVYQALLGNFNIVVTWLDGKELNIRIGNTISAPESAICIQGKGMIGQKEKIGNMYIIFNIEYPTQLSSSQREALIKACNYDITDNIGVKPKSTIPIEQLQRLINTPDENEDDDVENPFCGMRGQRMHVQQCPQQ